MGGRQSEDEGNSARSAADSDGVEAAGAEPDELALCVNEVDIEQLLASMEHFVAEDPVGIVRSVEVKVLAPTLQKRGFGVTVWTDPRSNGVETLGEVLARSVELPCLSRLVRPAETHGVEKYEELAGFFFGQSVEQFCRLPDADPQTRRWRTRRAIGS